MIVTKKRLMKEAVNTLMSMDDDSFFELAGATLAIKELLARFGIVENDLIAELIRRQQENEDG